MVSPMRIANHAGTTADACSSEMGRSAVQLQASTWKRGNAVLESPPTEMGGRWISRGPAYKQAHKKAAFREQRRDRRVHIGAAQETRAKKESAGESEGFITYESAADPAGSYGCAVCISTTMAFASEEGVRTNPGTRHPGGFGPVPARGNRTSC